MDVQLKYLAYKKMTKIKFSYLNQTMDDLDTELEAYRQTERR